VGEAKSRDNLLETITVAQLATKFQPLINTHMFITVVTTVNYVPHSDFKQSK
jgi:hypothetical protein